MALSPTAVTSRSNSDALTIQAILSELGMSPEARMSAIAHVAAQWDRATNGSSSRYRADDDAARWCLVGADTWTVPSAHRTAPQ